MNFRQKIVLALALARRAKSTLQHPLAQRIAWGFAVIIFVGGFAYSLSSQPDLFRRADYRLLVLVILLLAPMMTAMNALSTRYLATLSGVALTPRSAVQLAVMATAANHLPVPGGALLRIAAFQSAGASLSIAGLANIALGVVWISATFIFASPWAYSLSTVAGTVFLFLGVGLLIVAAVMGRRLPGGINGIIRLYIVCLFSAMLYALSVFTALNALGLQWTFAEASMVSVAGVLGAAASITPSGLGVREVFAAGIASVIGMEATAAFAATAIVHLGMLTVMGVCALYFTLRRGVATAG